MPRLEMTAEVTYRVHYRRLERFLEEVYRTKGWDFATATGLTSSNCPQYIVTGRIPPGSWDLNRQAQRIRQGYPSKNVALILNVLACDGHIPAGKYLIDTRPEVRPIVQYRRILQVTKDPDDPRLVALREANQHDQLFTMRARTLDEICREQMEGK